MPFDLFFAYIFRPKGLPRRPSEAQESSLEAPEKLKHRKRRVPKLDRTFFGPVLEQFWVRVGVRNRTESGTTTGPKIATPKNARHGGDKQMYLKNADGGESPNRITEIKGGN